MNKPLPMPPDSAENPANLSPSSITAWRRAEGKNGNLHPGRKKKTALDAVDLEILQSLADGETVASLARKKGQHINAVSCRIHRMKHVIPCTSTYQLIAEAVRKEYID